MSTDPLSDLLLLDHHCHGVAQVDQDLDSFELHLTEGFEPPVAGTTYFDSPVGLATRRWCAPLLDLPTDVTPSDYVAKRRQLGEPSVARTMLAAGGFERLIIDTGYSSEEMFDLAGMSEVASAPTHEVVRIETILEEVAAGGVPAADLADAFEARLRRRANEAVGFKTVAAYRCGLALDPKRPSRAEVASAYSRWQASVRPDRVEDPVLIRAGIWTAADVAAERGMPLQFHIGFGDPDARLHEADPSLMSDLLESLGRVGVVVALLHCYPFHRQAGHLSWVYPNVYFDVGLALPFSGPGAPRILAEAMELAPFSKQLFSTDARDIAELYVVGAMTFRWALGELLERWVSQSFLTPSLAEDAALAIASENARRIYPLPA